MQTRAQFSLASKRAAAVLFRRTFWKPATYCASKITAARLYLRTWLLSYASFKLFVHKIENYIILPTEKYAVRAQIN